MIILPDKEYKDENNEKNKNISIFGKFGLSSF